MSIIVVSDIHLGYESSNYADFSNFIDWVAALEKNGGRSLKVDKKEIKLNPPEKIILLGDILELWDPKDNDPKFTVQQAFEPFGKLAHLRCEKIFVLGNHDEDISEYLDVKMKLKDGSEIKENTFRINSNFTVINRHYPEDPQDETKGFLQVGTKKYFFLHGQQFDKLFISVGSFANMPTFIAKISSTFSEIFPFKGWSIVMVFAILSALYLVINSTIILTLVIVTFLLSIPRLFTYFQDKVWANIKIFFTDKPKYKDVQTIIEEKYYDFNKDTTGDDVNLVFGHTHVPEIYLYKFKINKKDYEMLFVNTGSWVLGGKYLYNTFVYLDETGSYLFKWNIDGNIELISSHY